MRVMRWKKIGEVNRRCSCRLKKEWTAWLQTTSIVCCLASPLVLVWSLPSRSPVRCLDLTLSPSCSSAASCRGPDGAMVPFEGNAPNLAGTVIALVVLGSIVLPLRIYVRLSNRAFGIDDWLMAIAAVSHKRRS